MRKGSTAQPRTLDAEQAIRQARMRIKVAGGLSDQHSREYWRFSTKAELRGPVEADVERFLQDIKDVYKEYGQVSARFLPGTRTWNEELAAELIADAKQGDADANQVLREVAAEFLTTRIPLPDELADYVASYLQHPNSNKKHSHKKDYRDWILAFTVHDIARQFKLNPTRNKATEEHCACSIVAAATRLSPSTVQNAWDDYKGVADQRTATNYLAQAIVTVTYDSPREYLMRPPRVVGSDGTQEDFLVQFPRVGSIEAMSRPSNRKAQRGAKRVRKSI
jgi:hypothetical protein